MLSATTWGIVFFRVSDGCSSPDSFLLSTTSAMKGSQSNVISGLAAVAIFQPILMVRLGWNVDVMCSSSLNPVASNSRNPSIFTAPSLPVKHLLIAPSTL